MSVVPTARRLLGQQLAFPVVSVYLDLDPDRFATAPARVSQINSLLDGARREVGRDQTLEHEERKALGEDLDRISAYLLSREPPFKGAAALAVFCSLRDDLFEVVQLTRPVEGRVVIERSPYVEPLIRAAQDRRWCVALVSRRSARILAGPSDRLAEIEHLDEDVHGQHDQGGWSQAGYERSYEKDADDHLRRVAELIHRLWQRERFDRLALGGPTEVVPRLEGFLHEDVRSRLARGRVETDYSRANDRRIEEAVTRLVEEDERHREREALDRLAAGIGSGGAAAGGPDSVVEALNERRVQTLLLGADFDGRAARCPRCGLLRLQSDRPCPADGAAVEVIEHLREAVVESAVAQDAEIVVVSRYPDLGPLRGIGAVLRF